MSKLSGHDDVNFEVSDTMFYTLRSLYRFNKMIEINAPEFLIETESLLLQSRLKELTEDELEAIETLYPEFENNQKIHDVIQDVELEQDIAKMYLSLN